MRRHAKIVALAWLPVAIPSCAMLGDLPEPTASIVDGAPSTDTDGPTDASTTCPSFAFLCEDFERGNFSRWQKTEVTNQAVVQVQGAKVRAGVNAMHATVPSVGVGGVSGAAAVLVHPGVSSGTWAMRAYLFLPRALADDTVLARLDTGVLGAPRLQLAVDSGQNALMVTTENDRVPATTRFSSTPTPVGSWVCVEWIVTVGTTGHYTVRINGKSVLDEDENTVGSSAPSYSASRIGIVSSYGQAPQEVFVDDVVFASQPVGCQ